jgi:FMN phosphatase YigB (HAD superfamily)
MYESIALERVNENTALYVGDSLASDGQCAEQAGVDFAWIHRNGYSLAESGQRPKFVCRSLSGLLEALKPCIEDGVRANPRDLRR